MSVSAAGSAALSYSASSFSASSVPQNSSVQIKNEGSAEAVSESPAYIVSLSHNLDKTAWQDKVIYSKSATNTITVAAVDWRAIMNFADSSERSFGDTFLWNFVNNPHIFLRQGQSVDSSTARSIVAQAVIQAI